MTNEPLQFLAEMRAEINRRRRLRRLANIWHKLQGSDRFREVTRAGLQWKLQYYEAGKKIIRDGVYEPGQIEYFFTQSHKRGCDVFLDIGANFGYYSMLAAKMKLFEEIHAYEPVRETFEQLQWHIAKNNFTKEITPHQIAVGDSVGSVHMAVGNNPEQNRVIDGTDGVEVKAATLDSLFNFEGRRLAVKMDIETHEIPALRGAENLFAKNDVFLQAEVWRDNTETINYLLSRGFRLLYYIGDDFCFERERQQ